MTMDLFGGDAQRDLEGRILDDAHWTPMPCADACVADLVRWMQPPASLNEPSCGGGSFLRSAAKAWPQAVRHAVDIHPGAPGLAFADHGVVGDTLHVDLPTVDLSLGNRPFGGPDEKRGRRPGDPMYVGAHHILRELEHAEVVASILPWEWGAVGYLQDLLFVPHPPAYRRPIRPRAWSVVRACGWFVWIRGVEDDVNGKPLLWRPT